MKQWTWKQEIKDQLKLAGYTALQQIFPYYRLSPLKKHILKERAKMTRKLWLQTMYRDHWYCTLKLPGCTGRAQEVDHIIPLFKWGYTYEDNLQAVCHNCNQRKGIRIL